MPLLDHFHEPLRSRLQWRSFFSNWATRIADALTERAPPEFTVGETTRSANHPAIDIATFEYASSLHVPPSHTLPAVFPDSFEVRVFSTASGLTLVAAVELISPGNKDRAEERRAFAAKCASYLHRGVAVVLIDIVTSRRANLHNETMRLMDAAPECDLPADVDLYAVAYRPVLRQEKPEIDLWTAPVAVGAPLPTLPLRLTGDLFVPVEFEPAYQEACRRRRLA
jgi:hypothetical protein